MTNAKNFKSSLLRYIIFTEYPHYENIASGGLLVWPQSEVSVTPVKSFGYSVCYVPTEDAYDYV